MNLARQRLARQQAATLAIELSVDAAPVDAATPPIVTVRRAGTIVKVGDADAGAVGDGAYTFTLDAADTATLGELDVEWAAILGGQTQTFRTYHEVVGGHVFSLASMRKLDPLDDDVKYTLDDLAFARDLATYALEDACNTAFVRRRRLATFRDVTGKYIALNPHRDAALVSGMWGDPAAALDAATLALMYPGEGGLVALPTLTAPLVLTYEYGWQAPPIRVARAIGLLAAEWAQVNIGDSVLSGRETLQTTDAGTFRYVTAGEFGRGFDLPEVNAVVQAYSE